MLSDKPVDGIIRQGAVQNKQRDSMLTASLFQNYRINLSHQFIDRVPFKVIQFIYQDTDGIPDLRLGMRCI